MLYEIGDYDHRLRVTVGETEAPKLCSLLEIVSVDGAEPGLERKQSDCRSGFVLSLHHTVC